MILKDAVEFTRSVRESWQPEAKGYKTTVINIGHVARILGDDFPMEDIDNLTFTTITKVLKSEGKAAGTINRIQAALSTVHNTLVKYGHLTQKVQKTTLREPKGRMLFYTEGEVKLMVDACDELGYKGVILKDVLRFAYMTGARQGEILKLKWDDICYVTDTLQFVDTKTDETRVLPLTEGLKEFFKEVSAHRTSHDYVFPIDKDTLLRRLRRVQDIAGVSKEKCFHTFRHSAATHLFAKGAPLPVVKAVLGHKNTETTLRYAKATQEGITQALDSLDI